MKSQMTITGILMSVSFVLLLLPGSSGIAGGQPPAEKTAIKGYDPVAYFKTGEALKGNDSFSFTWHGMTWYFSTKENRDLFAASPEKYAPQYDGYCAWAMTESRLAITDPEVWKIVDGKLYLNCSRAAFEKWSTDIPGHIKKADANWLKLNSKN
jgi:YHS domain-containing protein